MKPLRKIAALAVVLICVLSFIKKENETFKPALKLEFINIDNVLAEQQFHCRPTSDFAIYVETDLVKKIRGASNINAKVFIVDKISGRKNLLAQENILVKKFEDAIAIKDFSTNNDALSTLDNGDTIIGGSEKGQFTFEELVKYDAIYNSYINATNKLLNIQRSI